jgi:hypothetical protein
MTRDGQGQHDFDFVFGSWHIANRRLRNPLDPECEDWEAFAAHSEAAPILGGCGHTDRMWAPEPPWGTAMEGFTLRLFEPDSGLWRIWWSSTMRPGRLDPPVEGRFVSGIGTFETEDVIDGVSIGVRFRWTDTTSESPRWEQAFSFDEGATWTTNWTMQLTREP